MTKRSGFLLGALFVILFTALVWMARDQILARQELRSVHDELHALHRVHARLNNRLGEMEKAEESPPESGMYLIVLRDGILGPVGIVPFDLDVPPDDEPLASSGEDVNVCGCADSYSCTSL